MNATSKQETSSLIIVDMPLDKKIQSLRSRLLGAAMVDSAWYQAVDALEYAIDAHRGQFRKGGTATEPLPYVSHPITATLYVMTLPWLKHMIDAVSAMLLHDVMEDCGVGHSDLSTIFNLRVADAVALMSKNVNGVKKTKAEYYRDMLVSDIATIDKPADRIHNQSTMDGAHSREKQLEQLGETVEFILPMVKLARRKYPYQERAYENIKLMLGWQVSQIGK